MVKIQKKDDILKKLLTSCDEIEAIKRTILEGATEILSLRTSLNVIEKIKNRENITNGNEELK